MHTNLADKRQLIRANTIIPKAICPHVSTVFSGSSVRLTLIPVSEGVFCAPVSPDPCPVLCLITVPYPPILSPCYLQEVIDMIILSCRVYAGEVRSTVVVPAPGLCPCPGILPLPCQIAVASKQVPPCRAILSSCNNQ